MATPIPTNAARFSARELVESTGGTLRAGPALEVNGVSTDTRTCTPGCAFVALSGERFDGHRFCATALEAGARLLVVSKPPESVPADAPTLVVADTLAALCALAHKHRERWARSRHAKGPRALIAIGGSAGKTTTTRAIAALLEQMRPGLVHSTQGNLNNAIGVSMTLLGLQDQHELSVVEIGTNRRGEVASLAAIARPDAALVTLIEAEHLEGLGSIDEVALEEGDLFAALGQGGIAIGNADDPRVVDQLARAIGARIVRYGFSPGVDLRIVERASLGLDGSMVRVVDRDGVERTFAVPLLGRAGALAAAAALSAAEALLGERASPAQLEAALGAVQGARDGRLGVRQLRDGTTLIDDTYNANPGSMRSSIETARELATSRGTRLVLVLGEMRELGSASRAEHESVAQIVACSGASLVVSVAGDAEAFARAADGAGIAAKHVATSGDAMPILVAGARPGDVVLVKGSRSVALEVVVQALAARAG